MTVIEESKSKWVFHYLVIYAFKINQADCTWKLEELRIFFFFYKNQTVYVLIQYNSFPI